MSADEYTRPERSAEFAQARRRMAEITRRGGCACCKHRVEGWGASACSTPGRVFPLCLKGRSEPQFEPDEATLGEAA